MFPDAIILGMSNKVTGKAVLNPLPESLIGPDDSLVWELLPCLMHDLWCWYMLM